MATHENGTDDERDEHDPLERGSASLEEHQRAVEFVASHPITIDLKALGITDEELDRTALCDRRAPGQFNVWGFRPGFAGPLEAVMLAKAYSTLKWLIIGNPPGSPDKEAGWQLLRETEHARLLTSQRVAQARHAEMTERGIAARTKYSESDRAMWQALATTDPSIAQVTSKSRQAELIAKRLGLPASAVQTIRKALAPS